MGEITYQTIIEGGILITLVFIGGVLVQILRSTRSIDNTVKGGTKDGTVKPG